MADWLHILESLTMTSLSLGATAADAVWFGSTDMGLSCRGGKLDGLERSESQAITLRVFSGDRQATVSSTDISEDSLKSLAKTAVDMAKIALPDPFSRLAPSELYAQQLPLLDLCDSEEPTAEALYAKAQEAEASALEVKGITNSEGADANWGRYKIALAIAEGGEMRFAKDYDSSHSSLSVSVLAGSGTDMQRDYDFSTARYAHDMKSPASIGKNAGERAVKRLFPRKIASGTMPVIYDRRVSRQLVSALASAVNGSSVARGSSFLRGDMDKMIFSDAISITDDPLVPRGMASKPFDGEGVATKKLPIIEQGRLASWVLDVRSGAVLGLPTTGHASRSLGSGPSPSCTNLYMHAGRETPEALMKQMGSGLFITETFGGGVNTITGDYSQGASGFLIENGVITAPVAEITIAGHLRDMFMRMVPANDLVFDYATNAPSLFIDRMAVAGA